MSDRRRNLGAGASRQSWRVLFVLGVAVLVPTACLLWFMGQAMRNQRLAVRQKLQEAYRAQVPVLRKTVREYWADKSAALAEASKDSAPPATFARLVRDGVCDSAILYDRQGQVRYPRAAGPSAEQYQAGRWIVAERLEYELNDPLSAAPLYAQAADEARGDDVAARALLASARCWIKAGRKEQAREVLAGRLAETRFRLATDEEGRFLFPDSRMLLLQLLGDPARPEFGRAAEQLTLLLDDYAEPAMPSSQRRFLMRRLQSALQPAPAFATLAAEDLAAECLQVGCRPVPEGRVLATPLAGAWCLAAAADATVLGLFRQDRVASDLRAAIESAMGPAAAAWSVLPASAWGARPEPLVLAPLGETMPDWQVGIAPTGPEAVDATAREEMAAYLWTGGLSILAIAALGLLVARYVAGQMKTTRLKNDLIATVSHELKTPLASMRALIEVLSENWVTDPAQRKEYLSLLTRENQRLSRLIDNFLTFSRMERDKQAFEFSPLQIEAVVASAVASARERFGRPACRLDVEVQASLPAVRGDRDALETVVLNLLDNAFKYTHDDKHVRLRAFLQDGRVHLEVRDNGIGLTRRQVRKVFDRFYQADRRLSRGLGGCGLGLSIVKFIVEAHGGTVGVQSEPGKGSTFTVSLPPAGETNARTTEAAEMQRHRT